MKHQQRNRLVATICGLAASEVLNTPIGPVATLTADTPAAVTGVIGELALS